MNAPAGKVIKGWDEGVRTMQKGELALLTCTAGAQVVHLHQLPHIAAAA